MITPEQSGTQNGGLGEGMGIPILVVHLGHLPFKINSILINSIRAHPVDNLDRIGRRSDMEGAQQPCGVKWGCWIVTRVTVSLLIGCIGTVVYWIGHARHSEDSQRPREHSAANWTLYSVCGGLLWVFGGRKGDRLSVVWSAHVVDIPCEGRVSWSSIHRAKVSTSSWLTASSMSSVHSTCGACHVCERECECACVRVCEASCEEWSWLHVVTSEWYRHVRLPKRRGQ
jgi:hypothetical protein